MGITNFTKTVKALYEKSVKNNWLESYDYLYIDINACLHRVGYISNTPNEIYDKIDGLIMNITQNVNPSRGVIIASDGPAPMAKLILQRLNRLKSAQCMKADDDDFSVSSLNFTPGTVFMNSLENRLAKLKKKIELMYCIDVEMIMNKPDETEIKVKKYVCEMIEKHPEYTHCIVSDDADVIVMSMNFESLHNVYILHKRQQDLAYINLNVMLDEHTNVYGCSRKPGHDFMAINVMLGNDYIKKIEFIDYEKLWKSYKHALNANPEGLITDDIKVSRTFLCDMFAWISNNLSPRFANRFKVKNYDKQLHEDYIDGLLWCIDTYNDGQCNRYDYLYSHKDSPSSSGLLLTLAGMDKYLKMTKNDSKPMSPGLYSILLIPKKAKTLLDSNLRDLTESDDISMLYEEEICTKCFKYNTEISNITAEMKYSVIKKGYKSPTAMGFYKAKISKLRSKLNKHKTKHKNITTRDIYKIKKYYDKYMESHKII